PLRNILGLEPMFRTAAGLLRDPDSRLRRTTIHFLELLEEKAAPAIPAVVAAMSDPDRFVRWAAARTLGNIAPENSADAVPGLAHLLGDPDLGVRQVAANTLEIFAAVKELQSALKAAVPALARTVNTSNTDVRLAAMETLRSFGGELGYPAA